MFLTPDAEHMLNRLLLAAPQAIGLAFDGAVGSCRASVPLLKPVVRQPPDHLRVTVGHLVFFVRQDYLKVFQTATMHYETGLFARGLNLTWPHTEGGCPNCRDH